MCSAPSAHWRASGSKRSRPVAPSRSRARETTADEARKIQQAPAVAAAMGDRLDGSADGSTRVGASTGDDFTGILVTFANHPAVTNPMTEATRDTVLGGASGRMQGSDFAADLLRRHQLRRVAARGRDDALLRLPLRVRATLGVDFRCALV